MTDEVAVQPDVPGGEGPMALALRRAIAAEKGEQYEPEAEPVAAEPAAEPPAEPEAETPEGEEAPKPAATAEVEIDGKTYVVPSELKDGYLRQSDYTKKTQETAKEREAAVALKAQAEQTFQILQSFGPVVAEFETANKLAQQYANTNWDALYQQDPILHNTHRLNAQENLQRLQNLGARLQQAPSIIEGLQRQAHAEEVQRNLPKALELVPDLDKRGAEFRAVGLSYGYTAAELDNISDPRAVAALRDLAEFKKLTKDREQIRQQVQTAPPVSRPGVRAATPQASTKEYNAAIRAVQTDRSDDAVVNALRVQRRLQGK